MALNATLRTALGSFSQLRHDFEAGLLGDVNGEFEKQARRFVSRRPCWIPPKLGSRIFTLSPEPFDPAKFTGADYKIWRGPKDGNGLEGEEAQDKRSLALSEVDMFSVRFENMLNEEDGEGSIKGEEKILRLKMAKFIRLDARLGRDLLAEPGQATLEWLFKERGIAWFDLPGTILRDPRGRRLVLSLYRRDGEWGWDVHWLESDWYRSYPSAVLVS